MTETIILDPTALDATRTQLDITGIIQWEGIDWGDAEIAAFMADQAIGSMPVDFRIPNRKVSIPLVFRGMNYTLSRSNLQQKVGLLQKERGTLLRLVNGASYYADVVNATLHLGGSTLAGWKSIDVDATLQLECLPDWYGNEVTFANHAETTNAELVFTETGVAGSYPGRVRIVVSNDGANDFHGLLWAFRSKYYSNDSAAALMYEAEALTPLDAAATFAHAGASGGNTVKHAALPGGSWCPVLSTGNLIHTGSYRVWARSYSATATPRLRFLWDVGDMTNPNINAPVILPTAGDFYVLDFGQIQIRPAPVGAHHWQGIFQAYALSQDDPVEIDKIWFQPIAESSGMLTVNRNQPVPPQVVSTSPGYPDTAADATGVGTVAWTIDQVNDNYTGSVSSASTVTTHYFKATNFGFNIPTGATILGFTVTANCKSVISYHFRYGASVVDVEVKMVKGGTIQATNRADTATPWPSNYAADKVYGDVSDLWGTAWAPADVNASNFGVAIAATLKAASYSSAQAVINSVNITVFYKTGGTPSLVDDAVVYTTKTAELRTDGMYRLDAASGSYGPVPRVINDLPRVPVAGLEGRTLEVFMKPSRGDFDTEPDSGIDDISARLYVRPCYLYTA